MKWLARFSDISIWWIHQFLHGSYLVTEELLSACIHAPTLGHRLHARAVAIQFTVDKRRVVSLGLALPLALSTVNMQML